MLLQLLREGWMNWFFGCCRRSAAETDNGVQIDLHCFLIWNSSSCELHMFLDTRVSYIEINTESESDWTDITKSIWIDWTEVAEDSGFDGGKFWPVTTSKADVMSSLLCSVASYLSLSLFSGCLLIRSASVTNPAKTDEDALDYSSSGECVYKLQVWTPNQDVLQRLQRLEERCEAAGDESRSRGGADEESGGQGDDRSDESDPSCGKDGAGVEAAGRSAQHLDQGIEDGDNVCQRRRMERWWNWWTRWSSPEHPPSTRIIFWRHSLEQVSVLQFDLIAHLSLVYSYYVSITVWPMLSSVHSCEAKTWKWLDYHTKIVGLVKSIHIWSIEFPE